MSSFFFCNACSLVFYMISYGPVWITGHPAENVCIVYAYTSSVFEENSPHLCKSHTGNGTATGEFGDSFPSLSEKCKIRRKSTRERDSSRTNLCQDTKSRQQIKTTTAEGRREGGEKKKKHSCSVNRAGARRDTGRCTLASTVDGMTTHTDTLPQ